MSILYRKICMAWTAVITAVMIAFVLVGVPTGIAKDHHILASAAETDAAVITAQIAEVEIDMEQLEKNHYLVTVPVTVLDNDIGFEAIQCGAAWDTTHLTALGAKTTGNGLLPNLIFNREKNFIWMQFMAHNYVETDLCTITFQVNENAKPGDYYVVQGEAYDLNGDRAECITSGNGTYAVEVISGGIHIVDDIVPAVSVEIGDVIVEEGTLEENDYIVEVPVKATVNNGFFGLRFVLSWDASKMQALPPSSIVPEELSIRPSMSAAKGEGWVEIFATETYTGSSLCTLQFALPDTVKPGDKFQITAESVSTGGIKSTVISTNGTEGTLSVQSGSIMVRSTQPVTTFANANIAFPKMEVTLEDLQQNDYQVSYPICVGKNSAFTKLAFGASWDASKLSLVDCVCDDLKNLEMNPAYSRTQDAMWMDFTYQGIGGAYLDTALCTLTIQLNRDVAVGDSFEISAEEEGFHGVAGEVVNTKGEDGMLILKSGSIEIITEEERDTEIGLEVGDVTVDTEDLYYSDNEVSVPILVHQNTKGLSSVSFGISWDAALAQPVEVKPADSEIFGVRSDFDSAQDAVWLTFISIDSENGYDYYESEQCIGYLVLRLADDIAVDDVVPIYMDTVSRAGVMSSAMTAEDVPVVPAVMNGSVRVVGDAGGDVTTTASTEWTKPTLTSTETLATTAAELTTIEITTALSETSESTSTETIESSSTGTSTQSTATSTSETETSTSVVVEQAYLSHQLLTLTVGRTASLTFYPDANSDGYYNWLSQDSDVVRVDTIGSATTVQISALRIGVTTVAVMCNGEIYRCEITVVPAGTLFGSGDVDMDGIMDTTDLVLINKLIIGAADGLSEQALHNADLNGDGCVDCKDSLLLLQKLMKVSSA